MDDTYLEPGDAARLIGLSTARIRQLCDAGVIPTIRTARGTRLIRQSDVERLARERAGCR